MTGKQKRHRVCEICGIRERHSTENLFFAKFPLDADRCKEWIKVTGKEDLVYHPIHKIHQLRHVCGKHFTKRDFTKTGSRLKKHAVPKLYLLNNPLSEDCFAEFPLKMANEIVPTQPQQEKSPAHQPSTSHYNQPDKGVEPKSNQVVTQRFAVPSTSTQQDMTSTNEDRKRRASIAVESANPVAEAPKLMKRRKILGLQNLPNTILPVTTTTGMSSAVSSDVQQEKSAEAVLTKELSPLEKDLIQELKEAKSTVKSLKKNAKLIENIDSSILKEIVEMTLKNQKRKPRGRRWTTKYKISLLAIFKRSPKAYRFLTNLLPLPSTTSLQNILKKVPMEPGVCQQTLIFLKQNRQKNEQDKCCCLLFDEMALKPRLQYNYATDKVEGYTDMGNAERSPDMADHALVFMLQGLRTKYKQPIAFFFVKGTVSSSNLASLIQVIIQEVNKAGYRVMATVCDQGPTNIGALKILRDLTLPKDEIIHQNTFKINDKPINIIYDVPHLIKSMRNNFLNYGTMKMSGKTARWEHLLKMEEKNKNMLFLSKVSPMHVQPKYRAKMKVKYAAQIFSNTVAAVLKLMASAEKDPVEENKLMETAIIVESIDKLFDSTNGPSGPNDFKKGRRTNVSAKTDHIRLWTEYRKMLESVIFEKRETGTRAKNVRCIQGYITTLLSLRDIWAECQRLGFKFLNLRQLNQDSLENLFGLLRQHSPTNKNPTAATFMAGMKTTIVSKMTAPHSRGSNCEKDSNTLLTDFHDLVFEDREGGITQSRDTESPRQNINDEAEKENFPVLSIPDSSMEAEEQEITENFEIIELQPVVYLSGYIAHSILKNHKCDAFAKAMISDNPGIKMYKYIQLREWYEDKKSLTYPSLSLCEYIRDNVNAFEKHILPVMHSLNIRALSVTIFMANSEASFVKCGLHKDALINTILIRLAVILIRRQCARINKRISIEEEKIKDLAKKCEQKGVGK